MHRFVKAVVRIVLILAAVVLVVPGLLYIPRVQTAVCAHVVAWLNESSDGLQYRIGSVRLRFPLRLCADEVAVLTSGGDTLFCMDRMHTALIALPLCGGDYRLDALVVEGASLTADSLTAGVGVSGCIRRLALSGVAVDPARHRLRIDDVQITDPYVAVSVTDAPADTTTSAPVPWCIEVGQLAVSRSECLVSLPSMPLTLHAATDRVVAHGASVRLDSLRVAVRDVSVTGAGVQLDLNAGSAASPYFDYNHMIWPSAELTVTDFCYTPDSLSAVVGEMAAVEARSGLTVTDFSTRFSLVGSHVRADDLVLRTPGTHLTGSVDLDWQYFLAARRGACRVRLEGDVEAAEVVRQVAPYLPGVAASWPSVPAAVAIEAEAAADSLVIGRLALGLPGCADLALTGRARHLYDPALRDARLHLTAALPHADALLSALWAPAGLRGVVLPDSVALTLAGEVTARTYRADLALSRGGAPQGRLAAAWADAAQAYRIEGQTFGLEASAFVPSLPVSRLSLRVEAEGAGTDLLAGGARMQALVEADSLTLTDGARLRALSVAATLADGRYAVSLLSREPRLAARGRIAGVCGADTLSAAGSIAVAGIDLSAFPEWGPDAGRLAFTTRLSAHTDLAGRGAATVVADSLSFITTADTLRPAALHAALTVAPRYTGVVLSGGDCHASMQVEREPAALARVADSVMAAVRSQLAVPRLDLDTLRRLLPPLDLRVEMAQANPFYPILAYYRYHFSYLSLHATGGQRMAVNLAVTDYEDPSRRYDTIRFDLKPVDLMGEETPIINNEGNVSSFQEKEKYIISELFSSNNSDSNKDSKIILSEDQGSNKDSKIILSEDQGSNKSSKITSSEDCDNTKSSEITSSHHPYKNNLPSLSPSQEEDDGKALVSLSNRDLSTPSSAPAYAYSALLVYSAPQARRSYDLRFEGRVLQDSLTLRFTEVNGLGRTIYDVTSAVAVNYDTLTLRLLAPPTLYAQPFTVNADNYLRLTSFSRPEERALGCAAAVRLSGPHDLTVALTTAPRPDVGGNHLELAVHRLDLGYLSDAVQWPNPARGRVDLLVDALVVPDSLSARLTLRADSLRLGTYAAGSLTCVADLERLHDLTEAVARLAIDGRGVAAARYVADATDATQPDVTASLRIDDLPLPLINAYLPADVRLDGRLSALLTATGTSLGEAVLTGGVSMPDAGVTYVGAGARLQMPPDTIRIDAGVVQLDAYRLRAPGGQTLTVSGVVDMAYALSEPFVNLYVRGDGVGLLASTACDPKTQSLCGVLPADVNLRLTGIAPALTLSGTVGALHGTDLKYYLPTDPLALDSKMDRLVEFVSFSRLDRRAAPAVPAGGGVPAGGFAADLRLDLARSAALYVSLSPDGANNAYLRGGGSLRLALGPDGDATLGGTYEIASGDVTFKLPMLPMSKSFKIADGSLVRWSGPVADPELQITATEEVRCTIADESGTSRVVRFVVSVRIGGTASALTITFTCSAPEDAALQSQIASLTDEERSRQALRLLVTQSYSGPGVSSASSMTTANAALNALLQKEVESFLNQRFKSTEIAVGIDTYDATGTGSTRTDYSVKISQRFMNDRMRVVVGGRVTAGAEAGAKDDNAIINDFSLEWLLKPDGSHYIRLFRKTNYESILEGEIVETGVGYVLQRSAYRLPDLFIPGSRRRLGRLRRRQSELDAVPDAPAAPAP